jgi:probable HAF family extracellular repeat protein
VRPIRRRSVVILGAVLIATRSSQPGRVRPAQGRAGLTLYQITQLGSLGGTTSAGNSINDRGWIAGLSNLAGDEAMQATLWRDGAPTNLGTLGGPNSAVLWPLKNNHGMIAGVAETEEMQPLNEAWSCSAFFPGDPTHHVCLGFVWQGGRMRQLPTLGGDNGFATGVNDRGRIVGWAENTVHDPTCNLPQVLQFRAVVWDGHRRRILQELPPVAGDTVSAATAINDEGQVVGISWICANAVGGYSAAHAVLWENGASPIDLGTLGGVAWNTPMAINQGGEVVGFANVPGGDPGAFNAHAFRWTEESGMQDLGTLPGDALSEALGLNDEGQVVGLSCTAGFGSCRAFLWENGVMRDLNSPVPGYEGHLVFANDINNGGVITGQTVDAETGDALAFRATPIEESP